MSEDGVGGMPKSPFPVDGMLGGFPIRLLDMIVSQLCVYSNEVNRSLVAKPR